MIFRMILSRLALAVVTLFAVSIIIFWTAEILPGDIAARVLGREATPEAKAAFRKRLNLDRPVAERYVIWLGGAIRGDFGKALSSQRDISEVVGPRLRNTLFLAAYAFLLYVPVTILLAILAAVHRERFWDGAVSSVTLVGLSLPEFVVGTALIYIFAVNLKIFPVMSLIQTSKSFWDSIRLTTLPAITLMIAMAVYSIRMLRDNLIEVLDSEYVRMATLKGMPRQRVVSSHALPNSLVPALNTMALNIAYLIGGVVIVEQVFVYPGLGTLLVEAIFIRDAPVIEAVALIVSSFYILANLFADVMGILLDPPVTDKLMDASASNTGTIHKSKRAGWFSRIRRLPRGMQIGGGILIVYLLVALTGDYWAPYDYNQVATGKPFESASLEHYFGTDQLGRDVFSRVVEGTDIVLFLALTSTLLATIIGGALGLISGFAGGWFDQGAMRVVDIIISIPFLVLGLLLISAAGPALAGSYQLLIFVIAFVYAPRIARMTRAVAIDLVMKDFVTVARTRGESIWSIVWNELLPNATGVILVEFGVRAGYAPIFVGALGFLGLGVRPPTPEWGLMISENRSAIVSAPIAIFAPAIALAGLVIGLNLFTDGMARVLGRSVKMSEHLHVNSLSTESGMPPLIEVKHLDVEYWQQQDWVKVIEGLSLQVLPGETFGLVGESGCGKSTTANALLGFHLRGARYSNGSVWFEAKDLLKVPEAEMQKIRGAKISLIPQNPTTALSPGMRVGQQIVETLLNHHYCKDAKEAQARTIELFRQVSLKNPEAILEKYPHQLSGGQQQRTIIAMALACNPKLVVLDEPTTGLDVTTQAQILDLLVELRGRFGITMFYITHNLGVVAQLCTRIGVMYAGRLVEVAPTVELFSSPQHPYTQGLIASVPRISRPSRKQTLLLKGLLRRDQLPAGCQFAPRCDFVQERCFEEAQALETTGEDHQVACWRWRDVPAFSARFEKSDVAEEERQINLSHDQQRVLTVKELAIGYGSTGKGRFFRKPPIIIVDGVSFDILPGETLALVGESGSGKTTVARALTGLTPYTAGDVAFSQTYDLTQPVDKRSDELLRSIQLIFQNPDASLNPRQQVSKIIGRPLQRFFGLSGGELRKRIEKLLEDVRLDRSYYNRYPDELSGGERQRIAIARALAAEPTLLLCDEVLSALDVSVQANILELLIELQDRTNIAYLFITHDLAVVRSIAHRVGVLYWGALCELGRVDEVYDAPSHPYTEMLLKAIPEPDPSQRMPHTRKDVGLVVTDKKYACPFAGRCPVKLGSICEEQEPPWRIASETHSLRCHIPLEELSARESQVWQAAS